MTKEEQWIYEDWEHQYLRDEAYIEEGIRREIQKEWEEWEYQHMKPAKIIVTLPQEQNNEIEHNSGTF